MVAAPAVAADVSDKALGTYENAGDYWQRVKIARAGKPGRFSGAFDVASGGCQGDVKMTGAAAGSNRIVFSEPNDVADGGMCRITVTFAEDFGSIEVSHGYCGYLGAGCDFNGRLKRKGRKR